MARLVTNHRAHISFYPIHWMEELNSKVMTPQKLIRKISAFAGVFSYVHNQGGDSYDLWLH